MGLLNVSQVAERMCIGYAAALALIHAELLPTVDIPGRRSYRVDEADVDVLIQRLKSGTVSGTEDEREPEKTAPNEKSRSRSRSSKKDDKYSWQERYTRK